MWAGKDFQTVPMAHREKIKTAKLIIIHIMTKLSENYVSNIHVNIRRKDVTL